MKKKEKNMFSYQIDIYENKAWKPLKSWARPFTDGTVLDDTLDAGAITLSLSDRQEPIKPFTKLRIIINEDGVEKERIYRLVATSKRTRRVFAPSLKPLYDWQIQTVELTKELERRFMGTITVTKALQTDYATGGTNAPYILSDGVNLTEDGLSVVSKIKQPIDVGGMLSVPSTAEMFKLPENSLLKGNWYINTSKTFVKDKVGNVLYTSIPAGEAQAGSAPAFSYVPTKKGELKIVYDMDIIQWISVTSTTQHYSVEYTFAVNVFEQIQPKTQPTITSVCERLLSSGITRRRGINTPEYTLDETFAAEYADVASPEFSFSNCTLFEALSEVGGYIHAIPRLVPRSIKDDTHYKVTFDKLGGNEQAPDMPPMLYQDHTIDINDWCGTLDCPAQNLCNTVDESGSITELGNDYITVRTEESNIEINGDNVLIRTSMPIQKLVKLECGFIPEYNDGTTPVGDITAYVYEAAEYSTLSSYWGTAYPYSKAWALCYAQNDNKITGLAEKQAGQTSVSSAFNNAAIVNIINAVTGLNLTVLDSAAGEWMRSLAFKVTYVPIVTSRVTARKPSLDSGAESKNALVYNQGSNVAETSFYGEKMRGAVARLGRDVEQRTYLIKQWNQMPKCGQLLDGKYIATIDAEYDLNCIRATLTMTKNFNQLSRYVGLNSNYRLYDISEKQSVERFINYSELILVGSELSVDMREQMMLKNVPQMIESTIFENNDDLKTQVALLLPYDSNGEEIGVRQRRIVLPVASFPFGNSICFAVSYHDNYGAGYQSTNEFENEKNKAVQRLVPYTDSYGEIAELRIIMGREGWSNPSINDQVDGGNAMTYPQALDTVNLIPNRTVDTGNVQRLIIDKDSREHLNLVYQVHFVSARDSLVIGPGMSRFNKYVGRTAASDENTHTYIIWSRHTINGLNRYVEPDPGLENGVEEIDVNACEITDAYFSLKSRANPTGSIVYSYAIARNNGQRSGKYELLFGENYEVGLNPEESIAPVYFSPAHDGYQTMYFANAGTAVYAEQTLELEDSYIGRLVSTLVVHPNDELSSFVSIADATVNRYHCWFEEKITKDDGTTKVLQYKYWGALQLTYADGAELQPDIDYVIGSDGKTISLLNAPSYGYPITVKYRIAESVVETMNCFISKQDITLG
ncbi:MAG: hypothetical protein ACI4MZ_01325 [Christensenellales bacterium]